MYSSENTDMYCLHIAEDDGEVDTDFPSLDSREPVSKFGFTKLALVEKEIPTHRKTSAVIVTVYVLSVIFFSQFSAKLWNINEL